MFPFIVLSIVGSVFKISGNMKDVDSSTLTKTIAVTSQFKEIGKNDF